MTTRYVVSMHRPHTRLFDVQGRFDTAGRSHLDLVFPVWTPGSYLVREYARHLQEFAATDGAGQPLSFERIDKRTFRIATNGAAEVQASWRVYANDLTVRAAHLDATHGYFNGAALFLHDASRAAQPHALRIDAPAGWNLHTTLPAKDGGFEAKNFDQLLDCPVHAGPEEATVFTAAGVRHELVIWGRGNFDRKKVVEDLQAIVEVEARMFGGLPFDRYLFLVLLADKGRGGLEHETSTTLLYPRHGFRNRKSYEEFLTLAAHEYFHLWNVKRIKPKRLVPFDYGQEQFTKLLWAFEGFTSYFDNLLTHRAGRLTTPRYLEMVGEGLSTLAQTPGRLVQSLDDASTCAWVKYYRQDENSPNSGVSYYLKGELAALLLDLSIRKATANARSLDDVMRLLWQRHGDGSGVDEGGIQTACEEVAGISLEAFFGAHMKRPGELDLSLFDHVGLQVKGRPRTGPSDKGGDSGKPQVEGGWLGATTRTSGDRLFISTPLANGPAMQGGLEADDELVALEGWKVAPDTFWSRLEEFAPGQSVTFELFRREELRQVKVTLGERPHDALWLAKVEKATDAQKAALASWIGQSWDALELE